MAAQVLIVGAGPTGLVMACALARSGISFRLIDPAAGPTESGGSVVLQPRSLEILEQLGVKLTAHGRQVQSARFFVDGTESLSLDFALLSSEGTPFPFQLNLPQRELVQHLRAKLQESGADAQWRTHYLGEADSERYVVGCDGSDTGSAVWKAAGLTVRETGPHQTLLQAEATLAAPVPPEQLIGLSQDGYCALFPLGERKALLMGSGSADLASLARSCLPSIGVTEASPLEPRHFRHGLVERYFTGRAFLCGTTAHIQSPAAGQEVNAGIQDAWNLAWKLSLVLKGRAGARLLDSYEAERRPVGQFFAGAVDRLFEQATHPGAVQALLRKIAVPALARSVRNRPDLKRIAALALSNLGVHYRQSAWVGGDRAYSPQPGDRAPDCDLPLEGGTIRLFQLLEERFVLLLFAAAPASVALHEAAKGLTTKLEASWPGLVLVAPVFRDPAAAHSPGEAAHLRFNAANPALVLVRPDGHVGWRSAGWDLGGLTQHLRTLSGSHGNENSTIQSSRRQTFAPEAQAR